MHFGTRENSIQLNFGENFEDMNYRVDIYEAFTYHTTETSTTFNFTTSVKVTYLFLIEAQQPTEEAMFTKSAVERQIASTSQM